MGATGGGISRHRPDRRPAARADRPCRRGGHRAVGPWHGSYIDTTVNGTIVRAILGGISKLDPPYHQPGDWARFEAFREAIDDDADHTVKAIEC